MRKDINDFPEYVDLFYSRNYKFFYNQLKNKQDYRKIFGIKSNLLSFFWRDDSYKKGKDVVVNKYQLYKNMYINSLSFSLYQKSRSQDTRSTSGLISYSWQKS